MESPGGLVYEFGEFRVDPAQRLLRSRVDGEPVALTPKVFETLLYLVEHAGQLVEKTTLMKAIWPNVVVEENNLNQNVSTLRRVLGESAGEHRYIVTVPGRGYRFVASVRTLTRPPAASTTATPAVAGIGSSPASRHAEAEPRPIELPHRLRLAVLPFDNLSPDPANAFFTDGLHEEILATLARKAATLEVVSRTTMMGYRLNPKAVREVAREVAASHVLEGSVRREGDTVRLTLQLIDADTDRHLWSSNFDRTLTSALTLQSEVAREVAAQLSVQLAGGTGPDVSLTKNPEAYDAYLKCLLAVRFVGPQTPVETWREIEGLFSRAIELDPGFASAYARRAMFRSVMFAFNHDVGHEHASRIRDDVTAGLRLAPDDPLVRAAEALRLHWVELDLPGALAALVAAEATHPADPFFLGTKADLLLRLGHADEACRLLERAIAIDPGNPFLLGNHAGFNAVAKRPLDALRIAGRALQQFPGDVSLQFVRALILFNYTGRTGEWRAALDDARRGLPPEVLIDQEFAVLRVERRYDELAARLDAFGEPTLRVLAGQGATSLLSVGRRPTAQYQGWAALLRGERASAARHGHAVLEFVDRQVEAPNNTWFLRLLRSHGHVFLAQHEAACAAAREALALMPPTRDALRWFSIAPGAAAALAWSDATDEAVTVLEALATAKPGSGPAMIARDPWYVVPLAGKARYRALADRVEAQLRAVDAEL